MQGVFSMRCFRCFPARKPELPFASPVLALAQTREGTIDAVSVLEEFSPNESREILAEARRRVDQLLHWLDVEGDQFVRNGHSGSVELYYRSKSATVHHLITRGDVFLADVDDLCFVLKAINDPTTRKEWDHDILKLIEIRHLPVASQDESLRQVYNAFRGRFGAPGRDFVWNVYNWNLGSVAYQMTFSIPENDCPSGFAPGDHGHFIRAETFVGGYRLIKESSGIRIQFVNQSDIKAGSIPDWLLNPFMRKTPERIGLLAQFILKQWHQRSGSCTCQKK